MSATTWLRRVGRMDRAELVFRARTAARAKAQYLATAWRTKGWRREALAALLRPSAGSIDAALERLGARDWLGAHRALSEHFHRRVTRFPVSPHALPELADRIRRRFPRAAEEAAERADRLVGGRFDLLGYQALDFASASGEIDWHYDPVHDRRAPLTWWSRVPYLDPALGDHKIIWELNRHQHFLALGRAAWLTGRPAYRDVFVRHLQAWLRANPPLIGINWASMLELALRSISWLWAMHLFVESPAHASADLASRGATARGGLTDTPWLVDLLVGLERQLSHVQQNLSLYFSPNTHLTGEALALYVCGRALPELVPAAAWADTGRQVLLEQIERQIGRDGGHVERSTHYQRYTLDFYLLALAMARLSDDEACADRFADAVDRLATATRLYADDEGQLPLIGDDDGGVLFPMCGRPVSDVRDSLATAAALLARPEFAVDGTPEETMWLLGNQPSWILQKKRPADASRVDPRGSAALADTGYYVSRRRPGHHLVIDGGLHGFLNGGHAHADALSLTASLGGRRLFVDPGTGTYTMSRERRDRFRDSRLHNTLTLDGRSQSVPAGPFHWQQTANARLQRWVTSEHFDYFEGVHDGYLPAVHRRRVVIAPGGPVLVVDSVLGVTSDHEAEVYWHLDPDWCLDGAEGDGFSLRHRSGAQAWLRSLSAGADFFAGDESGVGWHAPAYGRVVPALALRLRLSAAAPFSIVTLFGEGNLASAPRLRRLAIADADRHHDALALAVDSDGRGDLVVFGSRLPVLPERGEQNAPRTAGPPAAPLLIPAADLETDARFLCVRFGQEGEAARVAVLDGSCARVSTTGESLLPADEAAPGLFVR